MKLIGRRQFLFASGALFAAPYPLFAQPSAGVRTIGVLSLAPESSMFGQWARKALLDALRATGHEEGRNLVVEWRWGSGKLEAMPALAADLVARKVEVIVAILNDAIAPAIRATQTIPIVMMYASVPVEMGFIASLNRPGGNVTGTTYTDPETSSKFLQFLKEARPSTSRVAILRNPAYPGMRSYGVVLDRIAPSLGIRLQYFDVERAEDVPAALERMAASRPDGFLFGQDPVVEPRIPEIVAFARKHKLPSIGSTGQWANSGGLLTYSPEPQDLAERTASYVDRILRGAKPADLPVEQPTKYQLVVNLQTAKTIDLTIPKSLLVRATRVIE